MRISDWSSDVCSSDLRDAHLWESLQEAIHQLVGNAGLAGAASAGEADDGRQKPGLGTRLLRSQIGRASCRERVCQYVSISVVAVSIKKKLHVYKYIYRCILASNHQMNLNNHIL